jgi:hypothetical protein
MRRILLIAAPLTIATSVAVAIAVSAVPVAPRPVVRAAIAAAAVAAQPSQQRPPEWQDFADTTASGNSMPVPTGHYQHGRPILNGGRAVAEPINRRSPTRTPAIFP